MKQMYQLRSVLQNHYLKQMIKENRKVLVKSYHQPNDTTLDIELKDNIKFPPKRSKIDCRKSEI